jgi:hypothetical protein
MKLATKTTAPNSGIPAAVPTFVIPSRILCGEEPALRERKRPNGIYATRTTEQKSHQLSPTASQKNLVAPPYAVFVGWGF